MIKQIYIDNFKSICDFQVKLEPINVFIGSNAVGKSTILQAIFFMKHLADGTVDRFLSERNWDATELRSKLGGKTKKKNINFHVIFELDDEYIAWGFTVSIKDNDVIVIKEDIASLKEDKFLLSRHSKIMSWLDEAKGEDEHFPQFSLSGSMLSLIDVDDASDSVRFPHLTALKRFLNGIDSYELLSPEKMRKPSRNETYDLGIGGERLASFINGLSSDEKQELFARFQKYYPFAKDIQTIKKRSGWIDLNIEEAINDSEPFPVNVKYMSDGLLRILFLVALASLKDSHSALLLDEVENGINPDLAATLVKALIDISKEKNKQIFITTHSPTFLDYFEKEHVLLLWREQENGFVRATHLFDIPEIKQHLSYMNLGEIWASYDQTELARIAAEAEQAQEEQEESKDDH